MGEQEIMTPAEVAELLRMKKSWVYTAARQGVLPHVRLGRAVRFRRSAIADYLAGAEQGGELTVARARRRGRVQPQALGSSEPGTIDVSTRSGPGGVASAPRPGTRLEDRMPTKPSRPRGTGRLFTRTDSSGRETWYGSWYDSAGTRKKQSLGPKRIKGSTVGLTRAEAEEELRRRMSAARPADPRVTPASVPLTVEAVGALVVAKQQRLGRAEGTSKLMALYVRVHLGPYFGEALLGSISRADVDAFIAAKLGAGLKPKTVRNLRAALAQILAFAKREGWIASNPVEGADMPQVNVTGKIRFLDPADVERLASFGPPEDALGREVEGDLYRLAAWTGIRMSELLALAVDQVDFEAMRVRVERQVLDGKFVPTKGVLMRSVPLSLPAAQLLARRIERLGDRPSQLVFPDPEIGGPISRHRIGGERFQRAVSRASVRTITFHELRHTFGTQCARTPGVDIVALQHWMGHKDIKTTQVYLHYAQRPGESELVTRAFASAEPVAVAP